MTPSGIEPATFRLVLENSQPFSNNIDLMELIYFPLQLLFPLHSLLSDSKPFQFTDTRTFSGTKEKYISSTLTNEENESL
jgi:hypothetical protein